MSRHFFESVKVTTLSLLLTSLLISCATKNPSGTTVSTVRANLDSGLEFDGFDNSVAPQEDFYQFVNGGWLARTKIPADKASYGAFSEVYDNTQAQLREIVEDLMQRPLTPDSKTQKVAELYSSFMDAERADLASLSAIQSLVDFAGDVQSIDDVMYRFGYLQRYEVTTPIGMWVGQDAKATDQYVVYINQSGLGMPDRDYYFKDEFADNRDVYRAYIAELLSLAAIDNVSEAAMRIFSLERNLAELHWPRAKNRDRNLTYNKRAVATLDEQSQFLSWPVFYQAADLPINQDHVVVRQPDYLRHLDAVIGQTDLGTWSDYFRFHVLSAFAPYLSAPFVDAHFAFYSNELRGIEQNRPRWKRGLSLLDRHVGELLGELYVDKHFPPHAKARMDELIVHLHQAFAQSINQLDWMSDGTKQKAQQKLAKFNSKIGYPDRWRDYSELTISDDLIANLRRSHEFEYQRNLNKLGQPVDRDEWFMNPQTVNAYYSPNLNEIVFPAAILQPPFFDVTADDAVNYGAIGGVIGHEFSHGFDDQGRKSDGDGNLTDWWTKRDAEQFEERAKRLVIQYHDFEPLPGMPINGELTLGENIADLAGISMSYRAYLNSLAGQTPPVLDGFSGQQRFFIGWAKVWRGLMREDELKRRLTVAHHSPHRYRVIGPLANVDEFYEAFVVEPGDGMYLPPEQRAYLW
ncbi:MAG: M13 family metallopeptidase [Gammaproteobacteria bacterium]|nr:M13 family metallopeptidase [Gammaproteobacteria bacterium]